MVRAVENTVGAAARAVDIVAVAAEGSLEIPAIAHVKRQYRAQRAMLTALARVIERAAGLRHFQRFDVALHQWRVLPLERDDPVDNRVALAQIIPGKWAVLSLGGDMKRECDAVDWPVLHFFDEFFESRRVLPGDRHLDDDGRAVARIAREDCLLDLAEHALAADRIVHPLRSVERHGDQMAGDGRNPVGPVGHDRGALEQFHRLEYQALANQWLAAPEQ